MYLSSRKRCFFTAWVRSHQQEGSWWCFLSFNLSQSQEWILVNMVVSGRQQGAALMHKEVACSRCGGTTCGQRKVLQHWQIKKIYASNETLKWCPLTKQFISKQTPSVAKREQTHKRSGRDCIGLSVYLRLTLCVYTEGFCAAGCSTKPHWPWGRKDWQWETGGSIICIDVVHH